MFKVGYEYKYYLSDNVYICLAVSSEGDAILKAKEGDKKFLLYAHVYDKYIEIPPMVTKYCIIINSSTIKEYVLSVVFTTEHEAMDYAKRYKEWTSKNVTVGKINYTPNDPFAEKC
mgnify:CR=1 FL=1